MQNIIINTIRYFSLKAHNHYRHWRGQQVPRNN